MKSAKKANFRKVAVVDLLRPKGVLVLVKLFAKNILVVQFIQSRTFVSALKNALVWMLHDAKLKTLTMGLYYEVNDRVRVSFCYGERQNSAILLGVAINPLPLIHNSFGCGILAISLPYTIMEFTFVFVSVIIVHCTLSVMFTH